jgi:hypothetical protein
MGRKWHIVRKLVSHLVRPVLQYATVGDHLTLV